MALQDVTTIPLKERNRETGIPAVGAAPWGTHLCCFYDTKQDLIDILVPYFKVGLENNEFCIWVTSEPLNENEAEEALRNAVPDFAQYLEKGQIEIIPYTDWYLKDGVFNKQRVLNAWIDKLDRALDKGYDGLRLTGNTSWLEKRNWRAFTDYEEEINNVIGNYRMIALCTYSLGRCGASEIINVVSHHQSTLTRQAGNWVLIESSERKRLEDELTKFKIIFDRTSFGVAISRPEGEILYVNESYAQMHGYAPDELIGKHFSIHYTEEQLKHIVGLRNQLIQTGRSITGEMWRKRKDGTVFPTLMTGIVVNDDKGKPLYIASTSVDITERKRAEESQETASPVELARPLTPLQKRFTKSGLEGFDDQEIVELLLSLCPSGRQRQIRERASKAFKNVRELLSASPQELRQAGLPPLAITYIRLLHDIPAEVLRQKIVERSVYNSSQEIFDYLYYSMRDLKKEVFKVIYLNKRDQIIDVADLFEGTLDSIPIHPREIVDSAIKHNASFLIFVHNHTSGDPSPSRTDKQLTRDLVFVGNVLQIRVLDHIIIGENRYFSFADDGLIQKYEDDFLNIRIRRI